MNTKLTINLRDGILDVEGSDEFVRAIYDDFKGEVARRLGSQNDPPPQIEGRVAGEEAASEVPKASPKPSRAKRAGASGGGQKTRTGSDYKPTFDSTLNLKGLPELYDELGPLNAAEKILIFGIFLKERLKLESFTADHIYTCFFTVRDRTKIPEAFVQAFRDTQSRTHYIQVNSLQDITVTIAGSNHFEEMKKRKAAK